MRSKKTESDPPFDDDRSLWDKPFRNVRGLAEEMEQQDARVRQLRLELPLKARMNVLVLPWLGSRRRTRRSARSDRVRARPATRGGA